MKVSFTWTGGGSNSTDFVEQLVESPMIPLDFSEQEIQEAKDYAYKALKRNYPVLRSKLDRENLSMFEKVQVINTLSRQFVERVEEIRKRK